jgi:hypothetical protein
LTGGRQKMEKVSNSAELSEEFASPEQSPGKPGVAMRFGQWGGLRVLRDLRVGVVG